MTEISGDEKPSSNWDEARYIASLAELERINNQIASLRNAIPSMINPLLQHQGPSSETTAKMRKAAMGASLSIQQLQLKLQSEEVQAILSKSSTSLEKDNDLNSARQLSRDGWMDKTN